MVSHKKPRSCALFVGSKERMNTKVCNKKMACELTLIVGATPSVWANENINRDELWGRIVLVLLPIVALFARWG